MTKPILLIYAYSLLKTGKVEHGIKHPLFFKAFGDYKLAAYGYTQIPSIAIFGLNEFASHFPAALFGVFSIALAFLLTKKLLALINYDKTRINSLSLLSAFLLSISPWHIMVSRAGNETSLMLFLIVAGAVCLFQYLISNRAVLSLVAFVLFALSILTYRSASIFLPLFLFAVFITSDLKTSGAMPAGRQVNPRMKIVPAG